MPRKARISITNGTRNQEKGKGMDTLNDIALECGTDKSSVVHDYCRKYEKYLPFPRSMPMNILEIGVAVGASLRMWERWFFNSSITGMDINFTCKRFESPRITVEIGSQADEKFLYHVNMLNGPFDLIVDDGSHQNAHQILTFQTLFPLLKDGGIYVVEDTCTSYWAQFGGGLKKEGTCTEYFKGLIDEVNFFGELVSNATDGTTERHARRDDILLAQFDKKAEKYIGTSIESITFLNSIIIIKKR